MNGFGTLKFTRKGLELKSKSEFTKVLQLTKFKIGDGLLNGKDIRDLEDLISTKIDNIQIISKRVKQSNQVEVRGYIDNSLLEQGFFWRELGLYAKDTETDEEILYLYGNSEELTNYIPNKEILDERYIKLILNVSDDVEVKNVMSSNILVTTEDLQAELQEVEQETDAKLRTKLNKDNIIKNSFTLNSENWYDSETENGSKEIVISDARISGDLEEFATIYFDKSSIEKAREIGVWCAETKENEIHIYAHEAPDVNLTGTYQVYKQYVNTFDEKEVIEQDARVTKLEQDVAEQNRLLELHRKNVKKAEIEEEYITVTDSAEMDSSIILKGNSIQEETPSRNSPVEIKNIAGNIKFTVCEKNLLNFDSAVASSNVSNISISDDNIVLTASNANNNMAIDVPIKLKTSKTYSIKQTSSTCQLRNDNEELIYNVSNKTFDTFSLISKADFVRFWFDTSKFVDGTVTVKKSDFMFVEGTYTESTMPDYEKFLGEIIEFPLEENQKMLKDSYLSDDGIHHRRTQIALNGTENFLIGFDSTGNGFKRFSCSGLPSMKSGADNHIICSHFIQVPYAETEPDTRNKECIASASGNNYRIMFVVNSEDFATAQDFKNWLAEEYEAGTPVTIEYELSEENEIVEEYTAEQQDVYNKLKKYTLKKGINNIFSTDDISPIFKLTYTKATDIVIETLEDRIEAIESLLSTTTTAAMLIDNLETDLESEVNSL